MDGGAYAGTACTYVDPVGVQHEALITACWKQDDEGKPVNVNVVYVSTDPAEHDQYGRQIKRETSVLRYDPATSAHGRYFKL